VPTLRAEVLAANGEPRAACGALVAALRIDPGAGGVISRMQKLGCAAVDPELVQSAYRDLLASHPAAARSLPALLTLGADVDDAEAVIERLSAALAAAPDDIELRSALVDALLRLRRLDAALAVVDAVPDVQASHPLLLRARGVLALARGADRDALVAFRDLAAMQPDSAEAAYLLAEAEARTGNADAARYHLLEAWRRNADHPLGSPVVARVFAADTDPRVRQRLIGDLKRGAPDSPVIEPLQAQALLDAGHPDQAAEVYAAMHARDPGNPRLFARLVRTLVTAGQREPVIDLATPWMERHPRDAVIALALADVHADLGHSGPAVRWYRRVLELQPNNLFALNDLAVLLTETNPEAALALAARAHALAPDEPQVMDTYGAALLATGDTTRARALLTEAFGYRRSDPGIGLNLARAMAADGDADAARRLLRPLLEEEFPRQAEARALLQRLSVR
jgi:putative PEP-CTERM system TPR-repeat lipoprotein